MRNERIRASRVLQRGTAGLLGVVLLSSCAAGIVRVSPVTQTAGSVTLRRVPLRVALVLTDEFRTYKVRGTSAGVPFIFDLGDALVSRAERLGAEAFLAVTTVRDATDLPGKDISVLVTPGVVAADFVALGYPKIQLDKFQIKIRWSVVDLAQRELYTDTIVGEAARKRTGWTRWSVQPALNECAAMALDDHFAKALASLVGTEWWAERRPRAEAAGDGTAP